MRRSGRASHVFRAGARTADREDRRRSAQAGGAKRRAASRRQAGLQGPARSRSAEGAVMSASREERRERLVEIYREASVCELCPLSETRTSVVFGSGNADADLMFVGEAPG